MLFKHLLRTQGAVFSPNDDSGTPPVTPPVDDTPPVTPPVTPPSDDTTPPTPTPPSDETARLVKDVMKNKEAKRQAEADLAAANARLAAFGDATPEEIAAYRQQKADAERAAAEARGEYDRIVESMRAQQEADRTRYEAERAADRDALAAAQARIDELTVGRAFGDSKFLAENTVLSPAKARKLYGEHVEIVEGEIVVYDKPKGAKNRTPLVDARGENLSFEAAIEKVIKADPDFDTIGRSKMKAGSGSTPAPTVKDDPKPTTPAGKSRIAAGIAARKKAK